LRTGILLSKANNTDLCEMNPSTLRESFRNHGVVLSTYENGYIRLSMPQVPFRPEDYIHLKNAFAFVA